MWNLRELLNCSNRRYYSVRDGPMVEKEHASLDSWSWEIRSFAGAGLAVEFPTSFNFLCITVGKDKASHDVNLG